MVSDRFDFLWTTDLAEALRAAIRYLQVKKKQPKDFNSLV